MVYTRFKYATDCSYRTELEPLLLQPLPWQMDAEAPSVLIIHSHATESYTKMPGQDYQESSDYRTRNPDYNMVAVGDALAALLQQRGIGVIHDRQQHDAQSYNAAYSNSRKSVEEYLREYPSICMVLDLHRDAALNADGTQYATSAMVNGEKSAQIMLLAGTDAVLALENPLSGYLGQTEVFLDMPLDTTSYSFLSAEVPFLPMVLSGNIPYYSSWLNFESNQQKALLKLVEYGAYPSWLLTGDDVQPLIHTNSSDVFSAKWDVLLPAMVQTNAKLQALHEAIAGIFND